MANTALAESGPSKAAIRAAAMRAQHQIVEGGSIFSDPLAIPITGQSADTLGKEGHPALNFPRQRQFVAARCRFAEDALAEAVARGMRQVVVLGAGLETLGLRNPHVEKGLRVFEIDRPALMRWKQQRIKTAKLPIPRGTMFVGVDFAKQSFMKQLIAAKFRPMEPAFFIWPGAAVQLDPKTVQGTLGAIAKLPSVELVFDYVEAPQSLPANERAAFHELMKNAKASGEPWRSLFKPADVKTLLTRLGFSQIQDLGPDEVARRYFREGRPIGNHLVRARKTAIEIWA